MTGSWKRPAFVLSLFLSFLAITLQGARCEENLESIPPEDLCRPYIEKALKGLGTGSVEQTSAEIEDGKEEEEGHEEGASLTISEEADDTKEDIVSQEENEEESQEEHKPGDESAQVSEENDQADGTSKDESAEIEKGDNEAKEEDESTEITEEEKEAQQSAEADAGVDVDADTDADSDADSDVDTDADASADTDKDANASADVEEEEEEGEDRSIEKSAQSAEEETDEGKEEGEDAEGDASTEDETIQTDDTDAKSAEEHVKDNEEESSEDVKTGDVKSNEEDASVEEKEKGEDSKEGEDADEESASKVSDVDAEHVSKEDEETNEVTDDAIVETTSTEASEETKTDEADDDGKSDEGGDNEENEVKADEISEEDRKDEDKDEKESEQNEASTEKDTEEEKEKEEKDAKSEDEEEEKEEEAKSRTRREIGEEEETSAEESLQEDKSEGDEGETIESEEEPTPEEDLIREIKVPENLRPRDHINQLLRLDEENEEKERAVQKVADIVLRDLKKLYDNAIQPLETLYKYRDLSNRHFGDPEIFSKPLVLFMGPWSGGKSSIINYLLDTEYTTAALRTGAEPSPAYFNILMYGEEEEVLDGTQLAADWTFSGLQKFGQGMLDRLRGLRFNNKLLEKVNIVEIPGILEIRKQVQRLFPFNDACQWFIDRADIIFLVYDPSKLDVGPETEAILDQLKGREYQTRIILNKADQVKPEELMRVQGALIWNISPLMSSAEPPIMYSTSLWSLPYEIGAPTRLLYAQERAFLRDLRSAIDKRVEHKIASARRFAVRVRNHAKMVDCYLTTYYNHKTFFGNKKEISDKIIENPQDYHIYEGLSTLTNISRYDLPDPDVYRDFFRLNPLYDFQLLSSTCTYFRGCPINRLDIAIAYDLPELVGKYKKSVEAVMHESESASPPS